MKYICILFLCICVLVGGWVIASKYKARQNIYDNFISFLVFAKNEVNFTSITVLEIVQKYASMYPKKLPFLKSCTEPIYESIHQNLESYGVLSETQKEQIIQFFDAFGMGDESSSINLLEHTIVTFREQGRAEREENQRKIHLIYRLSVLLAAGLAILLI